MKWIKHRGKTDNGELQTLAQAGIASLNLSTTSGTTDANGNWHQMADVWLQKQAQPVL